MAVIEYEQCPNCPHDHNVHQRVAETIVYCTVDDCDCSYHLPTEGDLQG